MADPELKSKVEELIAANPVLLFMKGTPDMPRCGFSMRVVQTLDALDAEYGRSTCRRRCSAARGHHRDRRLADLPQLYVNGELVGGADIVEEMFESGELAELLGLEQPEPAATAPAQASDLPAQSPPLQIE